MEKNHPQAPTKRTMQHYLGWLQGHVAAMNNDSKLEDGRLRKEWRAVAQNTHYFTLWDRCAKYALYPEYLSSFMGAEAPTADAAAPTADAAAPNPTSFVNSFKMMHLDDSKTKTRLNASDV